ncbi:MAG: hypothetical protein RIS43_7 [Actinomycetota bacterium]
MKVANLINGKAVQTISPSASINDLLNSLAHHHVGALVVSTDGKHIDGIVSERDVVRALPNKLNDALSITVGDLMTREVVTCTKDTAISELMKTMTNQRVRHVPVVDDDGLLVSIVSIGDVVKRHIESLDTERQALQDYINS